MPSPLGHRAAWKGRSDAIGKDHSLGAKQEPRTQTPEHSIPQSGLHEVDNNVVAFSEEGE